MNKTASARDILVLSVVMFALALAVFILYFGFNTAVTSMKANTVINSSNATVEALNNAQSISERWDYMLAMLFIGLSLVTIILAWVVGGHPLFMFFYFVIVAFAVIFATILGNVWESVTSIAVFGVTLASFPIMNHIVSYMPIYIAAVGIMGLIAMFAKPLIGGEQ